ncbi:carbohydrate ABC transporter permease [candidate division GN15 bacterium]|uniref:Carbohydrate ABC transporter permease n=1 Tax=candidate division GN15 bacterium TaxID=2072418 RepID=A0A855X1H9_9BACT|nr:MAG: carbohydrate ABC transporter permease [candidate division GN15 bacterium]
MVVRRGGLPAVGRYVVLSAVLAGMLFPFVWMLRVSLLPTGSIAAENLLSSTFTLTNFLDLFAQTNMGIYLINSLATGIITTLGNILFCFTVAYTLARYRTITNRLLFVSVIVILMIPAHIVIIPLYILCVKGGMYDNYWALILPWLVNPIGIFLVKQYIETIPTSMEEAARIDGAGELTILFRVMMPMCKPALAVLAIQVFFTHWNSFLFPYILTQSESVRTLPVGLAMFQGHQAIDWQHLMAGSTIAVVPVLIVFVILQRRIVSGITAGAIKQ